jgi:Protein of unknown function (DUF4038)/Domain of unknown function (DUF5060)
VSRVDLRLVNPQRVRWLLFWVGLLVFITRATDVLAQTAPQRPGAETALAATRVRVPRWKPHDFVFHSEVQTTNPFTVAFVATVQGPGQVRLQVPGFYDGQGTWKVRVAPTVEGSWSLRTESAVPDLNGRQAQFEAVASTNHHVHGGLRIDPQYPRHFVFDDGTHCFVMGYECDWLWALDSDKPGLPTVVPFLDKLAASGFNYVLLNAFAQDTTWRPGKTASDDYGPPPRYAWAGSNESPDHSRLNLAYWQHYDRVMQALYERGMVAHVMIKVYNKLVNWPAKGSPEDDLYFRWLIARYAAYPNLHWDFSKESNNEKDLDYKLGRIKFIRDNDPYRRPITTHTDLKTFDRGAYDGALDYRCDQVHKDWHASLLAHRRQHVWPVLNVEFGYECGPGGVQDKTYRVAQSPEEVCRRAWEVCMAGGYGAYYYTYTAWDVIRPQDAPPGYAYFKHLREFFESTAYWRLEPADALTSAGYCLAEPGKQYVVFLNHAAPFSLKLEGVAAPLPAAWYQPLTGAWQEAGPLSRGTIQLTPPAAWGDGPVALQVGKPTRAVTAARTRPAQSAWAEDVRSSSFGLRGPCQRRNAG